MTNKEYIDKLQNRYGDKYDYSKVDFTSFRKSVVLVCNDTSEEIVVNSRTILTGGDKNNTKNTTTIIKFQVIFH
ncbi:hypothetical protein HYO65_gp302 [Tenacibaculum phage PTm1]|uniref:Uncharacterized protein n=1 Tax=Tenacibaculum phage PTm1 TaxID=2547425 RepID=A0A5S9HXS0_9CAUD|nr:hypothetical protein HYO65_gp302 [Tenacibaculum phage PTm1]BBI90694.1 hypothetical protein [Tenacibaculum phage PTm1]